MLNFDFIRFSNIFDQKEIKKVCKGENFNIYYLELDTI